MTESTAIGGQSAILPTMGGAVKAEEVADNTNGNLIMRDIPREKKIVKLRPYALVLFGSSDLMSKEGHIS